MHWYLQFIPYNIIILWWLNAVCGYALMYPLDFLPIHFEICSQMSFIFASLYHQIKCLLLSLRSKYPVSSVPFSPHSLRSSSFPLISITGSYSWLFYILYVKAYQSGIESLLSILSLVLASISPFWICPCLGLIIPQTFWCRPLPCWLFWTS